MASPEITLYTNHLCPWAHRAHIAIKELGLPYKEVIIDLEKPREPWYLEVNPVSYLPFYLNAIQMSNSSSAASSPPSPTTAPSSPSPPS